LCFKAALLLDPISVLPSARSFAQPYPLLRDGPTRHRPHARLESFAGYLCLNYRFTLKLFALLVPLVVSTVTLSLPNFAFAGTFTLMRVADHETYLVQTLVPNLTVLVPRAEPKFLPVIVMTTVSRRGLLKRAPPLHLEGNAARLWHLRVPSAVGHGAVK